jgi:hypothetical protein
LATLSRDLEDQIWPGLVTKNNRLPMALNMPAMTEQEMRSKTKGRLAPMTGPTSRREWQRFDPSGRIVRKTWLIGTYPASQLGQ